jgi:DNA-binding NtrC family response regulator
MCGFNCALWLDPERSERLTNPSLLEEGVGAISSEAILVVDDLDDLRHLLRDFLVDLGFVVLEASNGTEAIYAVLKCRYLIHLLLTDIEMPGMDGFELANQINMLKPRMKTIYMSAGLTEREWKAQARLQDGARFIQKPFSLKDLEALIKKVLAEPQFQTRRLTTGDSEGSLA